MQTSKIRTEDEAEDLTDSLYGLGGHSERKRAKWVVRTLLGLFEQFSWQIGGCRLRLIATWKPHLAQPPIIEAQFVIQHMPRIHKTSTGKSRHDPLHVDIAADDTYAKYGDVSKPGRRKKSRRGEHDDEDGGEVYPYSSHGSYRLLITHIRPFWIQNPQNVSLSSLATNRMSSIIQTQTRRLSKIVLPDRVAAI